MGVNILRYPGGKSKVVDLLVPRLEAGGPINSYYEPFVGGGSVALEVATRWADARLLLADADPKVAAFWQVVSGEQYGELAALVEQTQPTVDLFRALQQDPGHTVLEQAFALLFLNRTAYSGKTHTSPVGGWSQSGKWKIAAEWRVGHIVKNIEKAHALLSGRTEVRCGSFETTWPTGDWTIYADPPYWHRGRSMYPVWMTEAEHRALADRLRGHPGYWLLSYDDCPEVRSLYSWAEVEAMSWTYSSAIKQRSAGAELAVTPASWLSRTF